MSHQQHRSVPCPATGTAMQFAALATVGASVIANAHGAGLAAMKEARERRANGLWSARLINAQRSSAEALAVARSAVYRVQELEAEVAKLRRSVASRDALIRGISANG
ncbi:hypothetical protein [Mesorhizobium sp. ES1-4]|uniref:hypothetical protein n=1 Tax=Mesorhizobium sp. ES1-4 TaxID=2876627 RepID=UPI001CC960A1|nr:hypothetical protein [Mesorhizobium sp. ES1-4]MBZ9798737.1 hypothetical protein [Mesorhizobium sp. ES1-4]